LGHETNREFDMKTGWAFVECVAQVLPRTEREPILGDMIEADEGAGQALRGVIGFVVRRQTELWKSWRPWLAGFGVALPNTFLLMGASLSVALSYMRLLCPEMMAQASLNKPSAMVVLLWQALLLLGWSWTGGFVVGSVSKRTVWASTLLCYVPCLFCLSRFHMGSMPRFSLLLFVLPAIWGAHRAFRNSRIRLTSALIVALGLTLLIVPTLSRSWQALSPQNVLLNWVLSIPAWYLVYATWQRRREQQIEHAA
jgi:hypothetical protein